MGRSQFVVFYFFRTGIVFYAVSLAISSKPQPGKEALPIIVEQLNGGLVELFRVAMADDKFDPGSVQFTLTGKTIWAYVFAALAVSVQLLGTDQTNAQVYCAAPATCRITPAAREPLRLPHRSNDSRVPESDK